MTLLRGMMAALVGPPGPTSPSILTDDPLYAKNSLLLLGNGGSGATAIIDQMGGTWTVQGNAQTNGSGAIAFDGAGDAIYKTRLAAIGTGNFIIEMRATITSLASDRELFAISAPARGLSAFDLVFEVKTTGAVRGSIQNGSGSVNVDMTSATGLVVAAGTYVFSFEAEGTTARVRINGTVVASGTITGTRSNPSSEVRVGELSNAGGFPRYLNGTVHWLRLSTGTSRYTGSGAITPPSDPPPSLPVPVYNSRVTMPTTNDAQGIATDGTHIWFSSSTTIYKYTKAGVLVTSRNVSGDAPVDKQQINGLAIKDGVLHVSAAKFIAVGTSWIADYDPDTLAYITHRQIPGDWFSEGLTFNRGFWWLCFHANKVVARVNPSTWAVEEVYTLTFPITGTSGGYGAGTGYDGVVWIGDYLFMNIHNIYNEDWLDVYYWNGTTFDEIARLVQPSTMSTQGMSNDPSDATLIWFAERNLSGSDSFAKMVLT